jgi:chromosome segregation ATPase
MLGGGDDEDHITLHKMQESEVAGTQRQLARLRKAHDENKNEADAKAKQLKLLEQQMDDLRKQEDKGDPKANKANQGIRAVENRVEITNMKLEQELHNKEVYTHMIKRLTTELIDTKAGVKTTNAQILGKDSELQQQQLQLHGQRQDQRDMEQALFTLEKQAAERAAKQEHALSEVSKAIEQIVQQRVRQEQMEKKREEIAARAKGDLGTEEEDRLKRMFVVRSLYSSMLEQKVQKEKAELERLEQGFQKIKSATGVSDVSDIILKFKTKSETKASLQAAEDQTRERIEQLKGDKDEFKKQLDDLTTAKLSSGGNREMFQEVDKIDRDLNDARKSCNDLQARATRLDLILEESRMSIRKFLSKLTNQTEPLPTIEQLPDRVSAVDSKVTRLLKQNTVIMEAMGATEDGNEKAGGHGQNKVNDMLFHHMMNVEPDTSDKNVRVKAVPSEFNRKKGHKPVNANQADTRPASHYGGDEEEDDDTVVVAEPLIGRDTVKKLSDLITSREKMAARAGKKNRDEDEDD